MRKRLKWLGHRIDEFWPGNWLIKHRMMTAGVLLSVMALVSPAFVWNKIEDLTQNYNRTTADWSTLGRVHEFIQTLTDSESKLRAFATSGNREWLNTMSENSRRMARLLNELEKTTVNNPYRQRLVHDTTEVYQEWFRNVVARYAARNVRLENDKKQLDGFARLLMGEPLAVRMHRLLSELGKDIHDSNMVINQAVLKQSRQTLLLVTYAGILFFVGFSSLMFSLWYTIIPGLNALLQGARELKKGNLDHRVHIQGKNETAELSRAFNEMAVSLKAQNEKLKELNQMKSDFVSTVSHELRTPLTAIKGSIGLILGGVTGPMPDDTANMLKITQKNTDRLIRLINEVLDIAKIEAGAIQMQFDKFSVVDCIEHSIQGLDTFAKTQGITVEWKRPEALPITVIDRDRIEQVITNLLSNAIKFTETGGTVSLACKLESTRVVLSVSDTGRGIPAEYLEKIFQKFQQAGDVAHKAKEGTGLGLTIAKAIIEEHGGQIWVESQISTGSTFYFSLPWNGTDFVETRKPSLKALETGQTKRILVIDDEPDVTLALQTMLEHQGFEVISTNSSRTSLALAMKHQPALIIMDLLMPDMDGYAVRKLLSSVPETKDIPVAVITVAPELHAKTPVENVVKVFSKPLVPDAFRGWIEEFFKARENEKDKAAA